MRLLDRDFTYVPAARTNIAATWRRFGWKPTTQAERRARHAGPPSVEPPKVRRLQIVGER